MKNILFFGLLISFSGFAQSDYGMLSKLPGGQQLFSITQSKTLATEYKNMHKLKVDVTNPLQEKFTWEIPKSGENQTLHVERAGNHRKVKRVTRTGRIPGKSGEDVVVSSLVNPSGDIQSHTQCSQKFNKSFVPGIKSNDGENRCTTWNKKSCEYVKQVIEQGDLDKKIAECNGLLKKVNDHQSNLKDLVADDHIRDVAAITAITGKKSYQNSFEVKADTLGNVTSVYGNFLAGVEICDTLNSNEGNVSFEKVVESSDDSATAGAVTVE
jgi:hypothetical protein